MLNKGWLSHAVANCAIRIASLELGDFHDRMATAAGASQSVLSSNRSGKAKRKSYSREFKLTVVNHYHENNLNQTCNTFSLNTKTIFKW